jgi:hypothetical protein
MGMARGNRRALPDRRIPDWDLALGSVTITTGRADSTGNGGGSITTDGWTYGFSSDVPWTDANNSWHDGGTPDCLPPLSSVDEVRFAWIEVSVEGASWRPVIWIDCRSVSP